MNVFSESLEDVMLAKNKTVDDIAIDTQLEKKNVSNYLMGNCLPNVPHAVKIADYFGCSLDYLLGLIDEPQYGEYTTADLRFYEHYLAAIQARGITHYRVTKDLQITTNIWHKWRDGAFPMIKILRKLAKYLGVTADSLVGRERVK